MVILISGPSHVGKTKLAQSILEETGYPYLSIDHLKMGLIRAGLTDLTPQSSDDELIAFLWPILTEMIKTAIENRQNLIIEGCYIPYDWEKSFDTDYQCNIRSIRLIMSERYIQTHFQDIQDYAEIIEKRRDDTYCTVDTVLRDNEEALSRCLREHSEYYYIDSEYPDGKTLMKGIMNEDH